MFIPLFSKNLILSAKKVLKILASKLVMKFKMPKNNRNLSLSILVVGAKKSMNGFWKLSEYMGKSGSLFRNMWQREIQTI